MLLKLENLNLLQEDRVVSWNLSYKLFSQPRALVYGKLETRGTEGVFVAVVQNNLFWFF